MTILKQLEFIAGYAMVRALAFFFSLMSWEDCSDSGAVLGAIAAKLFRKRFRLTKENIRLSFPEKTAAETALIAVQSWKNMGRTAGEFAKALSLSKQELIRRCPIENTGAALSYLRSGKGIIIHLGHIANWEAAGIAFGAAGLQMCAIARRIKNPHIDRWLTAMRQKHGGVVIPHKNPFFSSAKALKQGKILGILMDQNMPKGDFFVPFFGRPAATTPLTAILSLKTESPIFPLRVTRFKGGIRAVFEEPILPSGDGSRENIMALMQRLNTKLEEWILSDPGSWLWAHNRWKRTKETIEDGKRETVPFFP